MCDIRVREPERSAGMPASAEGVLTRPDMSMEWCISTMGMRMAVGL